MASSHSSHLLLISALAAGLLLPVACGDDSSETGSGGAPGVAGDSGSAGAQGSGGSAGSCATPPCADPLPGLSERPSNPTCVAPDRVPDNSSIVWTSAWDGVDGGSLMQLRETDSGFWFEAYRDGRVFVVAPDGSRQGTPIITVSVSEYVEMGLLGLALHPNFDENPYVYLYYADLEGPGGEGRVLVDRFTIDNPTTNPALVAASRKSIFEMPRLDNRGNHVGGSIEFNPISVGAELFLAPGDGGHEPGACNTPSDCESQDPATFEGKMLRIDVSTLDAPSYAVEVVANGLRNPFRWSFDSQTGDLWIGDVGDSSWEEVTHIAATNIPTGDQTPLQLGWPCYEGFERVRDGAVCDALTDHVLPVHVYGRDIGVSVIGGRVYRGPSLPGSVGRFFFNDIFPQSGDPSWRLDPNSAEDPMDPEDNYVRFDTNRGGFVGYAEGRDGELYGFGRGGNVYKLEAGANSGAPPAESMPALLSDTGCFDADGAPAAGLIPYDLNAPLWSDGAAKRRWLAIPDASSITIGEEGDFHFPDGSILVKEFSQGDVRVETRLFVKHPDGSWVGYSYAWFDAGGLPLADPQLVDADGGVRPTDEGDDWDFPSRGQCLTCHTRAADYSLGLDVPQLLRDFTYPSTGVSADQLETLLAIGVISGTPSYEPSDALSPYDGTAPASERVRAYLHSNCSSCHRQGAAGYGGRSKMPDLAVRTGVPEATLEDLFCGVEASADDLGLGPGALLVHPGSPGEWDALDQDASVLYLRMAAREGIAGTEGTMPQIGTREVDPNGLALMSEWINGLTCP